MPEALQGTSGAIVMPKLGLTMTEGTIREWCVRPGAIVGKGDVLFVVETEKASNDVEAEDDGEIAELLAAEGDTIAVGQPVALWAGSDADSDRPGPAEADADAGPLAASQSAISAPAVPPASGQDRSRVNARGFSTPYARKLAAQAGFDIAEIAGTGPRGRIQAADVERALRGAGSAMREQIAPSRPADDVARLHYTLTTEVRCADLIAIREEVNAAAGASAPVGVTAFIVMAAVRALEEVPTANALWRDGIIRRPARPGIAICVAAPRRVQVLDISPDRGIRSISAALRESAECAQGGADSANSSDAVMHIADLGAFNVRALVPVIDADQTYTLALGRIHDSWVRGDDGGPVPMPMLTLTLAADNRAVDYATAAMALTRIVELLEQPFRLIAGLPVAGLASDIQ